MQSSPSSQPWTRVAPGEYHRGPYVIRRHEAPRHAPDRPWVLSFVHPSGNRSPIDRFHTLLLAKRAADNPQEQP